MEEKETTKRFQDYLYYIIIGVVSVVCVGVMPLMGSDLDGSFNWPTTTFGWIVHIIITLMQAIFNITIFFSFMQQAKINVKNNTQFIQANKILLELSIKKQVKAKLPRSPEQFQRGEYIRKGITMLLFSILGSYGLANAILRVDIVMLIGSTISVLFSIVFGIFQMKKTENYWTVEFYEYAVMKLNNFNDNEEKEKEHDNN